MFGTASCRRLEPSLGRIQFENTIIRSGSLHDRLLEKYLNNVRFEHALQLVDRYDFNILDICLETGFSSSRYLNQMFLKKLDMLISVMTP